MATKIKIESVENDNDDMPAEGHNNPPEDVAINVKHLRSKVSAIEEVIADISDLREGMKDIFKDLKNDGYDVKAIRSLIRLRAMDPEKRREAEAILDLYRHALGMDD
jgi:uncharacterized protein (UPF0335 family)